MAHKLNPAIAKLIAAHNKQMVSVVAKVTTAPLTPHKVTPIIPKKSVAQEIVDITRAVDTGTYVEKKRIETHVVPMPSIKDITFALKSPNNSGSKLINESHPTADTLPLITSYPREIQDVVALLPRVQALLNTPHRDKTRKEVKEKLITEIKSAAPVFKDVPTLFDFQWIAVPQAINAIVNKQNSICIAPTGSGKTYLTAYTIKILRKYFKHLILDSNIFVITKPTLIEQTGRVIQSDFKCKGVFITSYATVCSAGLSETFLDWKTEIKDGKPQLVPSWNPLFKPRVFIRDEVQCLKRGESTQSKVCEQSLEESVDFITGGKVSRPFILDFSATPYSKPIQTRSVIVSIRPLIKTPYGLKPITASNFPDWIRDICSSVRPQCKPEEWSAPAMRRIQAVIEPYTIRFDKLQYKRKTIIKQLVIPFSSPEAREEYNKAFTEYCIERDKIKNNPEMHPSTAKLVALMKFRQKAEIIRSPELAVFALDAIKRGRQPIIACAFSATLDIVKSILLETLKPEEIAEVRGGQTLKGRQIHVDEFQDETRKAMLLMFSAGGAGLSLHQYAGKNHKPREVYLPPVWNDIELIQVLGRAHRVNSNSTTYQYVVWFEDTVEEEVAAAVKVKCSALKEVVGKKEDWTKFFSGEGEIGKNISSEDDLKSDFDDDDEDNEQAARELAESMPISGEDDADPDATPEDKDNPSDLLT